MHWRRTAPVQPVGALLLRGVDCVARTMEELRTKSDLFRALTIEYGEDWMVIFAATLESDGDADPQTILPALADATPLFEEIKGWWLPVGTTLALPDHAQAAMREALCAEHGMAPPLVIAPRFAADAPVTDQIDIYLIREPCRFGDFQA